MNSVCVVPVYNQVKELPWLLGELERLTLPCDAVLLVDDGSTDGSGQLLRDSRFPVLGIPDRRGIGHALAAGVRWALERNMDAVVVIAGNGKMLPSEMRRVLDPIDRHEADFVWGSRFMRGGASPNLPSFRRTSIPLVNGYVRLMTGQPVTDATCGYCALRLDLMERATFDWEAEWLWTYGFEYYLRAKVLMDGVIRWKEVPVTMRYPDRGPYSKIRPVVGWWAMLKPWAIARYDSEGFRPAGRDAPRVEHEAAGDVG